MGMIGAIKSLVSERQDGWTNILTNLGVEGRDPRLATRFRRRPPMALAELEALYEQDAIFARAIDTFPAHATRRWLSIKAPRGPEDFERKVQDAASDLGVRPAIYELARLARLEGGAAMILGVDDGQSIDQPIDMAAIQTVRHLTVMSKSEIWLGDIDRDPMSRNFREPLWYSFAGAPMSSGSSYGLGRIHWTRVIRIKGIQASARSIATDGWGLSEAERIFDAIRQHGTAFDYVEALLKDLVQGVIQIKGLAEILAHDDGKLISRLQIMSLVASAFNAVILDEGETYERRTIQLAGIPEVLLKTMDRVSSVTQIPVNVLFGQAPTGFANDDKASRTAFYDAIESYQDSVLRSPLERIFGLLLASKDGPTAGAVPEDWSLAFEPLESPTEAEKAATEKTQVDTDVALVSAGIIEPHEARTRLVNDPACPYTLDEPDPLDAPVDPAGSDVAGLVAELLARGQTGVPT